MGNFMKAELYKLMKSKSLKVIALLIAFLNITSATVIMVYDKIEYNGIQTIDSIVSDIFMYVGIFAAIVFASDYNDGTARQYIYRGMTRTSIYFGRLFSIILVSLIFPVVSFVCYTLPLTIRYGYGDIGESVAVYVARIVISVIAAVTTYVLFTLLIAILTRSSGISVAIVCVCTTMIPTILALADLFKQTNYSQYWLSAMFSSFMDVANKIELKYVGIIAALIVGLTTIECVAYNKQEV
ncbi:MAG: ABC transporter permease [Lachnospiraceae bacterium]|nr:ABC transporter permease [Lachnospiraceae bacterium]